MEPAGAQTLAGLAVTEAAHKLQGAGYAMIPPQWDAPSATGQFRWAMTRQSAQPRAGAARGILAGFSTGANVAAALPGRAELPGISVATVACDTGTRY